MNPLAALLDLRLWVPKGSVIRQPKTAIESTAPDAISFADKTAAPIKLQRPNITLQPQVTAVSAITSARPTLATVTIATAPQQPLRLAMMSLTPTLWLMIESSPTDGDAEHQLMHSLLQAIQKQKNTPLAPLKYFQWPLATRSSLTMGKLEDALSGLLHQTREQGCSQIVILNHQVHQLLIRDTSLELHTPMTHDHGFTLFFSYSLQAMQQNPQLKKTFWLFLKSQL